VCVRERGGGGGVAYHDRGDVWDCNRYLLTSNVPLHRPEVRSCPFSTFVVPAPYHVWEASIKKRHYVYPLHPTEAFFVVPSIPAALYMVYMKLMMRDYVSVASLMAACQTDIPFGTEATFTLAEIAVATKEDHDPNASAVRLKLFAAYLGSFDGDVTQFDEPTGQRNYIFTFVRRTPPRSKRRRRMFQPPKLLPGDVAKAFEVDVHYDSYLEKVGHVNVACRLSASEEMSVISFLQGFKPNAGIPGIQPFSHAMNNRLQVLRLRSSDAPDRTLQRALRSSQRYEVESSHPCVNRWCVCADHAGVC